MEEFTTPDIINQDVIDNLTDAQIDELIELLKNI